jgi:hypothetical protein
MRNGNYEMRSMSNVINLVQAYGGSIAGAAGIWTAFSLLWMIATAASAKFGWWRGGAKIGIAMASIFWMLHSFVWYYTIVQISAWDLFNSFHLGETQKRQDLFLIIKGATKLGLTSTVAMIVATIISGAQCVGLRGRTGEPSA